MEWYPILLMLRVMRLPSMLTDRVLLCPHSMARLLVGLTMLVVSRWEHGLLLVVPMSIRPLLPLCLVIWTGRLVPAL